MSEYRRPVRLADVDPTLRTIENALRDRLAKTGRDPSAAPRIAAGWMKAHHRHYAAGQRDAGCQFCKRIPLAGPEYHTHAPPGMRVEALDPNDPIWDE